jgi:hypothetical protein
MVDIVDPFKTEAPAPAGGIVDPFAGEQQTEVAPVEVVAQKDFGVPSAPKESLGQKVKGFGRSALGGMLFNFEDELEAMLRSGRISGPEYRAIRDRVRGEQKAFEAQHPISSGVAGVGGALLTAAPALLIPGAGEGVAAARVAGPLARIARAAGIGATEGGIAGFGGAEDKFSEEGALEAAKGAGAGALLAPFAVGIPAVVRSGVGTLRKLTGHVPEGAGTQKALEIAASAMRRAGKTPAEIEAELARLRAQGVPATLGEVGAPGVTAEVMRTPQGAELAAQAAASRAETGTRVGEQVTKLVTKGADYDASREAVVERMRASAKPNYAKAYAHGEIDDPKIKNIIDLPAMRPFWSDAMAAAERDASVEAARTGNPPVNPLRDYLKPTGRKSSILGSDGKPMEIIEYEPDGTKIPTVEVLDWLKRGMDEAIDRGYRTGGMGAKAAKDFRGIRDELTGRLDVLVPEYRQARAAFKGDAEVRDAFDRGMAENLPRGERAFESMRPAEVAKWAEQATDAERAAAFSGYGNLLLKKLTTATNPAAFVGDVNRMGRLRALAENPAELDVLETALKKESELFAQRGKALTGVSAAVKEAAREDFATALDAGNVDLISAALRSRRPGYFAGLALKVLQGKNYPPEVLSALTDVLKRGDPDEVAKAVVDLTGATERVAARDVARGKVRDMAAVAAGKVGAGREEPGLPVEGVPSYETKAPEQGAPEEETPAEFTPPAPKTGVPEDTAKLVYDLSPDEAKALAIVGEASPDEEEMRAVGHVLANRQAKPGRFGNSVYSMLTNGEFDAFKTGPDKLRDLLGSDRFKRALDIVRAIDAGDEDPTGGATHFLAPKLMQQKNYKRPSWAKNGLKIGQTEFFKAD